MELLSNTELWDICNYTLALHFDLDNVISTTGNHISDIVNYYNGIPFSWKCDDTWKKYYQTSAAWKTSFTNETFWKNILSILYLTKRHESNSLSPRERLLQKRNTSLQNTNQQLMHAVIILKELKEEYHTETWEYLPEEEEKPDTTEEKTKIEAFCTTLESFFVDKVGQQEYDMSLKTDKMCCMINYISAQTKRILKINSIGMTEFLEWVYENNNNISTLVSNSKRIEKEVQKLHTHMHDIKTKQYILYGWVLSNKWNLRQAVYDTNRSQWYKLGSISRANKPQLPDPDLW